jgi:hypothetical protein
MFEMILDYINIKDKILENSNELMLQSASS